MEQSIETKLDKLLKTIELSLALQLLPIYDSLNEENKEKLALQLKMYGITPDTYHALAIQSFQLREILNENREFQKYFYPKLTPANENAKPPLEFQGYTQEYYEFGKSES